MLKDPCFLEGAVSQMLLVCVSLISHVQMHGKAAGPIPVPGLHTGPLCGSECDVKLLDDRKHGIECNQKNG